MEWTKDQKLAIYENGSNILVAAAAGSGKTAVLVERIINKIINENTDIDRLLVVTFTNAAASEMRERILNAIYKRIEENEESNDEENEKLQRQITLLNKASICTIDSFCLDIIKNNFYELDISPNFRIADTAEIELLKQEILEELFEEKYEMEDKDFINLIHTYTTYKDDTLLKELILKIYTFIQSNPFPEKWLEEQIAKFNIEDIEQDFSKTKWGQILLQDIEEEIIDCQSILNGEVRNLAKYSELEKYKQTIENDIEQLEVLKINLDSWDKAYNINQNFEFITWPRDSKITLEQKEIAKIARDNVKKKLKKKTDKFLIFNSKEANQDIYDMYDKLKSLKDIIIEFGEKLAKAKKEKNILDFNDIEHFALNILVKEENGEIHPTEIAKKYREKYLEIAIDEYQDSNLIQEYILTSISNKDNMFMVGDVKQSIYKFRQARPDLFYTKYNTYKLKQEKNKENDLKIQLFKNFRSRKNILDFTNTVFESLMTENPWEIEYNNEEFLNLGASYQENGQDLKIEINVIETADKLKEENIKNVEVDNQEKVETNEYIDIISEENDEDEHLQDIELEARYVRKRIEQLIKSNYQVYDTKKQEFRNIRYKDIAILLRSTKTSAPIYEKELAEQNIPVFSDSGAEYLGSIEIQTIMSLLKIIDNPLQDIPLVTVLRSSIGGFTDNDLIQIRLNDKYDNFYNALLKAKLNVDENLKRKINTFLDSIEDWRNSKEYLALDELIWKIYVDTGYYNYVGLMPNGALRQANLKMLFERAKQYETASFKGLFNFINFIQKVHSGSGDLGAAKIIGENEDVVRIMSIHKSKGLEFPIVFLANTGKSINLMDLKEDILLHNEIGLGTKYIDYEKQIEYDTLSKSAISNKLYLETLSEEMRILYVALTRAKEKLIITGTMLDSEKYIKKIEEQISRYPRSTKKINPILVKKYKKYIDWITLVYKYNEQNIKNICSFNIIDKRKIKKEEAVIKETAEDFISKLENRKRNDKLYKKIKQTLEYKYPYIELSKIPTKASVSKLKEKLQDESTEIQNRELVELEDLLVANKIERVNIETIEKAINNKNEKQNKFPKPKFLNSQEKELTGAQKGTLIHLCMQKLDNKRDYTMQDIKELIEHLKSTNQITETEEESINIKKIYNFTQTEIWQRMKKAKALYKEKAFYINIPIKEIYKDLPNNNIDEDILVQGIIDLYFIDENNKLVLLDYKTDYVEQGKEELLIKKYEKQLELYKQALEDALNRKVDEIYIYSTWINGLVQRYET